jgi:hypothetical protein
MLKKKIKLKKATIKKRKHCDINNPWDLIESFKAVKRLKLSPDVA